MRGAASKRGKESARVAPRDTRRHGRNARKPSSDATFAVRIASVAALGGRSLISVFITQLQRSTAYSLSGAFRSVVRHRPLALL